MLIQVLKRDGRKVSFDPSKIELAIQKAIASTKGDISKSNELSYDVIKLANQRYTEQVPTVEQLQDLVEEVLIQHQMSEVAKSYILYREERNRVRNQQNRLMKTFHDITFSKSDD